MRIRFNDDMKWAKTNVYLFITIFNDYICRDGYRNTYLILLGTITSRLIKIKDAVTQLLKGMSGVSFDVMRKFFPVLTK